MKNVLDALKHHFATTTREQREKAWEEIESLNLEGPIAKEYIEFIEYEYPIPYLKNISTDRTI